MALILSHEVHEDYLEVEIAGKRVPQLEYEESLILWKSVFELCEKYDKKNIMVKLKARGRMPMRGRITYAFNLEEIGWQKHHKVAGITLTSQIKNDAPLVVKFANSAGYNAKLFSNEADALDWLLNDHIELSFQSDTTLKE